MQARLHRDTNVDFQLRRLLADGSDSMRTAVERIAPRIRTFEDWTRELVALANAAEATGELALAARYVRAAEFFVDPSDPNKRALYERFHVLFERAWKGQFERDSVRWNGIDLPVLSLPARDGAERSLVIHGGFDSFIEEFFELFLAFRAAGLRVIGFEGPGQGAVLHRQHAPMIPEWERPTAAVLDHFALSDVTLLGISLGGALCLRAAAFEPRIRRVISFDVLDDFFECVTSRRGTLLTNVARALLAMRADALLDRALRSLMRHDRLAAWGLAQGMQVMGAKTPSGFLRETRRYATAGISPLVRADALLLAGAEDHFVPVHQLKRQAAVLTHARSVTTRLFTRAEGGADHCQVGNFPLVVSTILDWLRQVDAG